MGERGQDAERDAEEARRLHGFRPGDRISLLGPLRGLPVRPLLLDLERAQPAGLPRATVQLGGQVGCSRELREARGRRVRGDQGREPAVEGRDRRDVGTG